MLFRLFMVALLCLPSVARAGWSEASSKHFIVYSEGPEWQVRKAAEDLEKYDYLLRLIMVAPDTNPPKVRIYLLSDVDEVRKMYGGGIPVVGFYVNSARASIAIGLRDDSGSSKFDLPSQSVLFHEYAHHVMKSTTRAAYPIWYVEGFAEYYGTTRILPGDVMEIGRPAPYRMASFRGRERDWLPIDQILTATNYAQFGRRLHLLYAQGWLLVHYLANNEQRKGQLGRFVLALNQGVDPRKAMDDAFGQDAAQLDKELRDYSRKERFDAVRARFPAIDTGPIETRKLSRSETALIKYDMALSRGVLARYASEFAAGAQRLAAKAPNDPYAASIVTEAEYAAGNYPAAREAATRWLALEPGAPRALMFRSLIETASLARSGSTDADAWAAARKAVADARAAAPSDPMIMEAYYDSFAVQGVVPPARAQNALYKAMELVPQDDRLRYKVAADFERRNLVEAAISTIRPSALRTDTPADEDEQARATREKLMDQWRRVGDTQRETPVQMLARLQRRMTSGPGVDQQEASATAQRAID